MYVDVTKCQLFFKDAWNHDVCTGVPYGPYKVSAQNVTLKLTGKLVRPNY